MDPLVFIKIKSNVETVMQLGNNLLFVNKYLETSFFFNFFYGFTFISIFE